MVSDNRWVATTKGIVVFLLTALLFVFWYDRDRELAESHVTAVRFVFACRMRGYCCWGDMSCCVRFMGMGWSVIGQNYGFCL